MIEPIRSLSVEVVPQAIIDLPVGKVLEGFADVTKGYDDLDTFEGASFKLDNQLELSVRRYSGYPENTATIYLDQRVRDVEHITSLIRRILSVCPGRN